MAARRGLTALVFTVAAAGCAGAPPAPPAAPPHAATSPLSTDFALPAEPHLANLRALTAGGENAEAYWSWGGDALTLQARPAGAGCDRIFRLPVTADNRAAGTPIPVSDGKGATTCSFFLPGDKQIIFASTEAGGAACPPRPDHSQGYVWALYPDYDIYRANLDGSGAHRLTTTPGYDAEGTVCGRDGSIVFTSVRDGDLDLYRMDADGSHVRRLTHDVGYDGGAVFNADCSRIVWRASRPNPGPELDDYKRLLARNLVRPTKLEIYVADADGRDPVQATYLDAASFGPAFLPTPPTAPTLPTSPGPGAPDRVIFASNVGDPRGREFDLWAIDVAGTRLERITAAPGFDGFPLFSPDGRRLALASNRATPPGAHDTNVFVADWRPAPIVPTRELAADRVLADVRYLADPARDGRGVGTAGLAAAGAYVEARFKALGLKPAGDDGGFRQAFPIRTGLTVEPATALRLGGVRQPRESFQPAGFSATGNVVGPLAFAGFGVRDPDSGSDDYANLDVKGKVVVVRRFAPEHPSLATPGRKRAVGDVRQKAWLAREHGAKGLLVVDLPVRPANAPADWKPADEAPLPKPRPGGHGDAGIPVLFVKRAVLAPLVERLQHRHRVLAMVDVALSYTTATAFNVVARLPGSLPDSEGTVVVGAHYDHLGFGEHHSLAPDSHLPHLGADDNASGTAALLEAARVLTRGSRPPYDIVFAAFSGEEEGVIGSTQFVRAPPAGLSIKSLRAMVNMDMVGRMRDNRVTILGAASAEEWPTLLGAACSDARIDCSPSLGSGFGPSDQMPFYAAGIPVAHFFTGTHADYHKPSDSADRINAAGTGQIAIAVASLALRVTVRLKQPLTFKQMAAPPPEGDARSFNAALGTIPDYGGPPGGKPGVLLAGVRPGAPAERGGLRRGDILIRLGLHAIGSVEDLMYALNASKPGETVTAVVLRDGQELKLQVTFEEGRH